MWKEATEEVKQVYGKEYMQSWVDPSRANWTSLGDTGPVIKAAQHALVSQHPKSRYLVGGTDVLVDVSVVSVSLEFKHHACLKYLTLKAPVTTAADDIHKIFFIVFQRK